MFAQTLRLWCLHTRTCLQGLKLLFPWKTWEQFTILSPKYPDTTFLASVWSNDWSFTTGRICILHFHPHSPWVNLLCINVLSGLRGSIIFHLQKTPLNLCGTHVDSWTQTCMEVTAKKANSFFSPPWRSEWVCGCYVTIYLLSGSVRVRGNYRGGAVSCCLLCLSCVQPGKHFILLRELLIYSILEINISS